MVESSARCVIIPQSKIVNNSNIQIYTNQVHSKYTADILTTEAQCMIPDHKRELKTSLQANTRPI